MTDKLTISLSGDYCQLCGERIRVQSFKGTGYCSENHRKELVKSNAGE